MLNEEQKAYLEQVGSCGGVVGESTDATGACEHNCLCRHGQSDVAVRSSGAASGSASTRFGMLQVAKEKAEKEEAEAEAPDPSVSGSHVSSKCTPCVLVSLFL